MSSASASTADLTPEEAAQLLANASLGDPRFVPVSFVDRSDAFVADQLAVNSDSDDELPELEPAPPTAYDVGVFAANLLQSQWQGPLTGNEAQIAKMMTSTKIQVGDLLPVLYLAVHVTTDGPSEVYNSIIGFGMVGLREDGTEVEEACWSVRVLPRPGRGCLLGWTSEDHRAWVRNHTDEKNTASARQFIDKFTAKVSELEKHYRVMYVTDSPAIQIPWLEAYLAISNRAPMIGPMMCTRTLLHVLAKKWKTSVRAVEAKFRNQVDYEHHPGNPEDAARIDARLFWCCLEELTSGHTGVEKEEADVSSSYLCYVKKRWEDQPPSIATFPDTPAGAAEALSILERDRISNITVSHITRVVKNHIVARFALDHEKVVLLDGRWVSVVE